MVGLAGEEGFVHGGVAFQDDAIDGAGFVGQNHDKIADGDISQGDVGHARAGHFVGDAGQAFGEGGQGGGGAADGIGFKGFAAGEHEDDHGAGQVFAQQGRGDDGDAGEEVGAELQADDVA